MTKITKCTLLTPQMPWVQTKPATSKVYGYGWELPGLRRSRDWRPATPGLRGASLPLLPGGARTLELGGLEKEKARRCLWG